MKLKSKVYLPIKNCSKGHSSLFRTLHYDCRTCLREKAKTSLTRRRGIRVREARERGLFKDQPRLRLPKDLTRRKQAFQQRNTRLLQYHLSKQYGLTLAAYEQLVERQGGVCAICGERPVKQRLGVDHNHVTGKIRGALCHNCNLGLGKFKDDIQMLIRAVDYLTMHGEG